MTDPIKLIEEVITDIDTHVDFQQAKKKLQQTIFILEAEPLTARKFLEMISTVGWIPGHISQQLQQTLDVFEERRAVERVKPLAPDEWAKSPNPCEQCETNNVYVKETGDHPDYLIHCRNCGHKYTHDGPDA